MLQIFVIIIMSFHRTASLWAGAGVGGGGGLLPGRGLLRLHLRGDQPAQHPGGEGVDGRAF